LVGSLFRDLPDAKPLMQFMTQSIRPALACALVLLTLMISRVAVGGITVNDNLFLGVWSPLINKWEKTIPICVWSEDGDTLYRVTASGLASGTQYAMTNDIGGQVRYRVFWHSGRRFKQRERLRSNIVSQGVFNFDLSRQCNSGPNAQLRVRVNKRDIDTAIPGIYNDTLILMLSPL